METNAHRTLDIMQHIWPYVSGVTLTILAAVRLWWYDRKQTKQRINDNAAAIIAMRSSMVTTTDLQACRDDVRAVDDENLEKIFNEIKENTKENAKQHQDIMKQIVRLHQ